MKDTHVNITDDYVCYPCILPYLSEQDLKENHIDTYNIGECAICGQEVFVTHKRNFNYLR